MLFVLQNVSDPALVEDPAKDAQYKESAVDSMRAQKDEASTHNYITFFVHCCIVSKKIKINENKNVKNCIKFCLKKGNDNNIIVMLLNKSFLDIEK